MNKIPVTFEFEGHQYKGTLDEVVGSGNGIWHLMVNGYYWGRLRRTDGGWFFDESKKNIAALKEYFGDVVRAWYE